MSMRKFPNTLALENLFVNIPGYGDPRIPQDAGSTTVKAFSNKVLFPRVKVVSDDCGTLVGHSMRISSDLIGTFPVEDLVDAVGTVIVPGSRAILEDDLIKPNGVFSSYQSYVRVRSLQSCTAVGVDGAVGVCAKCLQASMPYTYTVVPSMNLSDVFRSGTTDSTFWYLETVINNMRQTYVVYYTLAGGNYTLNTGQISQKPALVPTSLPYRTIEVEADIADTAATLAAKTAYAIEADAYASKDFTAEPTDSGGLTIKHLYLQTSSTTHAPYATNLASFTVSSLYEGISVGDPVRITHMPVTGFYHRLAATYSGSLLGLAPLGNDPLPVREEVFYANVSSNDVAIAYRELTKSLGGKIPADLAHYTGDIHDRLERSLMIIALYSVYSNMQD